MRPTRILLQTTIPFTENDWHIGRFSMLREHLGSLMSPLGEPLYEVAARNYETGPVGDPVLSELHTSDFDQLWIFAVDTGDGLSRSDCEGITQFRRRGGGILATRDHNDLGSSLCTIGGIGKAHYFHHRHPDPDVSRRCRDDPYTLDIDFPNYHSGANGDPQLISPVGDIHPLLRRSDGTTIEHFPAHPHEGGIGAPDGSEARVIATGKSLVTERDFNLIVAFESSENAGRGIAESSFHHFADYNWCPSAGCPDFVEESPGDGFLRRPELLNDIKAYVTNAAGWLSARGRD